MVVLMKEEDRNTQKELAIEKITAEDEELSKKEPHLFTEVKIRHGINH